jgi:hypothetical protein
MVSARYSARGPWAFAVRGLGTFASGVLPTREPDTRSLAQSSTIPNNNANRRAYVESGCVVRGNQRYSVPAWRQPPRWMRAREPKREGGWA